MAVPYHTHIFEIPTATRDEVNQRTATDKVVTPAVLGDAATASRADFATAAQGEKADHAACSTMKIISSPDINVFYSDGSGDGTSVDLSREGITIGLSQQVQNSISYGYEAYNRTQGYGALAARDKIVIQDIDARGGPDATTFLRGDGQWAVVSSHSSGSIPASRRIIAGRGLTGGGALAADCEIALSDQTLSSLAKADNAAPKTLTLAAGFGLEFSRNGQKSASVDLNENFTVSFSSQMQDYVTQAHEAHNRIQTLGSMADKNRVAMSDIAANGTPDENTYLRGDGVWAVPLPNGHDAVLPPGMVAAFVMKTPPQGWLACDGSFVSQTAYARLFAVIGTMYGSNQNNRTFRLPDLRGEFVRGWDNSRDIDKGRILGSGQEDALQNMTGQIIAQVDIIDTFDVFVEATGVFRQEVNYQTQKRPLTQEKDISGASPRVTFDASRMARTAKETRPRNIALLYCIKY